MSSSLSSASSSPASSSASKPDIEDEEGSGPAPPPPPPPLTADAEGGVAEGGQLQHAVVGAAAAVGATPPSALSVEQETVPEHQLVALLDAQVVGEASLYLSLEGMGGDNDTDVDAGGGETPAAGGKQAAAVLRSSPSPPLPPAALCSPLPPPPPALPPREGVSLKTAVRSMLRLGVTGGGVGSGVVAHGGAEVGTSATKGDAALAPEPETMASSGGAAKLLPAVGAGRSEGSGGTAGRFAAAAHVLASPRVQRSQAVRTCLHCAALCT
jgi:hypothetical protein